VRLGEWLVAEGLLSTAQVDFSLQVQRKLRYPRRLGEVIERLGLVEAGALHDSIRRYRHEMPVPQILVGMGLLQPEDFARALELKALHPARSIEALLVEERIIDEAALVQGISEQQGVPVVPPRVADIDLELLDDTPTVELRKRHVLPIRRGEDGRIRVAVPDSRSPETRRTVQALFGDRIEWVLATRAQIDAALEAIDIGRRAAPGTVNPEAHIVELIDRLIAQAISEGASDVHIEPLPDSVRVRFRLDGMLVHRYEFPRSVHGYLIGRLKVLSEADIAERRRHQDGRMSLKVRGQPVDVRSSFYVTVHGEAAALRTLNRRTGLPPLAELGFAPAVLRRYSEDILEAERGIVIMTGPTGSGKTTVLCSSIQTLNKPDLKIITAEDPVEYQLDGVVQCHVDPSVGRTYEETLRSIMRQDPDVIVIGEVRDKFSASVAIQAALTGHKVFTTFHTEDSIGGLLRLINMGIETFFIASTVRAVVAQRLVRRVCADCRQPWSPGRDDIRRAGLLPGDAHRCRLVRGGGCEACGFTGYRGRIGIFELLILNDELRDQLVTSPTSSQLREVALRSAGMITLREDALAKAVLGETTLDEVSRHTPKSDAVRPMSEVLDLLGY
jgi:type IV pilus assembly protein PilB